MLKGKLILDMDNPPGAGEVGKKSREGGTKDSSMEREVERRMKSLIPNMNLKRGIMYINPSHLVYLKPGTVQCMNSS